MLQELFMGIMKSHCYYVMIMSDSLITDCKLRKRYTYLQRKMSRNHQFKNGYMKCMKEMMPNRYAGIYLTMESITKITLVRST